MVSGLIEAVAFTGLAATVAVLAITAARQSHNLDRADETIDRLSRDLDDALDQLDLLQFGCQKADCVDCLITSWSVQP